MQRISALGLSLLGISLGTAVSFAQRVASPDLVQEEPVLVGVESNGFVDASAAMRMAEAAISNSVESAELDAAQAELAAPAVDRLLPQSEEQRIFQRANGGKYIEIASGLNYQDEAGAWKPSRVASKTQANGSVTFDELPVQHTFAPWSGQRVVVESSRRGGPVARSALGGLSYYDLSSGKSALIAWVTNSPVQAYDGGVFYERAFLGVDADILYKVHPWGLEQDVVIFGGLPDPKAFGMDPAQTKLCALTELVDFDLGQAGVERSGDVEPAVPAVASLEVSIKQGMDWKRLYNWQPGYAYPEEGTLMVGAGDAGDQAHPVAMRLFSAMGRVFLSEEVPVSHVAKSMPGLLDAKVQDGVVRVESIQEQQPLVLPPVRSDEKLVADQSSAVGPQAYIRRTPRYVLDYVNYTGSTNFNVTFKSGQTYYISGPFTINGSKLTIEPGAVVKLATNAYVQVQTGALDCKSHPLNPAYFTSAYDTNIGEVVLSGSSPLTNLYSKGLWLYSVTDEVRGVVFRYADIAINLTFMLSNRFQVRDVQVAQSRRGVATAVGVDAWIRNSIFCNGAEGTQVRGPNSKIEGCTFQNLTNWAVSSSSSTTNLLVYNSIFYGVSNSFNTGGCTQYTFSGNAAYNVTTGWLGSSVMTLASNTFAVGSYGSNYLAVGSAAINAGTTNADLLGLYHYTTATNGMKETNSLVDIGFHYGTPTDQDGDGLPDYLEDRSGDGQYASNSVDISDWQTSDTDGDGLLDGAEYFTHGTNPKSTDTDGDGVSDGLEVQYGTDPLSTTSTLWSVSGVVAYGGSQTGALHVLVTSYESLTNRPAIDYSFDEDRGGYTPDINGSGLEAIVYGATWNTNGAKGGCYTFDGNDRISLGRLDAANGRYNLTWTAWMRYTGGGVLGGLLGNTAAGNEGIMLMKGGENLRADITPQSRTQTIIAETGGLVTQGIWQMVSGTYDGAQVRLYLNGDLVATSAVYSLEPIRTSTVSATIGDVTDGRGWYFYGDLDEVRIYQSTFTANQMKSLFYEIGGSVIRRDWTTNVLASSTAFTVPNLPSGSNYWITAWRDANGNGRMDHGETQGRYSGFVGNLSGNSNNLAITLADPDLDGDGVVDYVETATMTDPRSSNSVPVSAAGQVIYSGGQTGPIYITARPYETIADTPLLSYSFNTSNTTIVLDESGNGITGLISNAKWTSRGIRSGAYRFDGNANINLGDLSAVEGRTGLTFGAWVNQSYSSSLRGIMGKMVSGGESFLLVSTPSSGSLNAQVEPQSRTQVRDAAVNGVATGMVWQYVAGTYDGQQTRLYLDGQLIATSPVYAVEGIYSNNTVAALGDVAVGRGWYMNGRLDDVHIYGRCFNTNEMYNLAASIRPENIIRIITNAQPGVFVFTNLPNARKYWFEAYRDSNGNGQRDGAEAWVVWSNNPAFLQTGATNVNLTLIDPDSDQDGMPDWWEIKYGLNPTSSIPGSGEGWWKFDETSGTNAANSAGSGYGGQLVNMATNAWTSGRLGNALVFDGTNDYVRVPQSPVIITGQTYTLSGWVWLDPSSANDYPSIISDMSTCGGGYPGFWLGYDQYVPGLGHMGGTCGSYFYAYNAITVTGRWMHIASSYDGSMARLYADGVQIAATSGTFTQALQSEIRIGWGNDPAASYFWKGKLDDVRLYKTAISSNAVSTMYDAQADKDGDGYPAIQEYLDGSIPTDSNSIPIRSVSGAITYSGHATGAIQVVTVTASGSWATARGATLVGPGSYTVTNVAAFTSVWVKVFRDINGNGILDVSEPRGVYAGNPLVLTASVTGIDMTMTDPDSDLDGLPDWWEIIYGLSTSDATGANGAAGDPDGDGVSNANEYSGSMSPTNADTDSDGMVDGYDPFPTEPNCFYTATLNFTFGYAASFQDGTGNHVWDRTFPVTPVLPDGVASISVVRISGNVDDSFMIGGQQYAWWSYGYKYYDETITDHVDKHNGQFAVDVYDYVYTNWQNNMVGITGTCSVTYSAVLMVEIEPTFDVVTDGDDSEVFTATVTPSGLSGLTYEWTWSAESGAGNNPAVDFTAPNANQTAVQEAHWYALPDDACDAQEISTYTLTCTVKHGGQPVCSDTANLSVTTLERAGETTPPLLQGFPSIAFNSTQGVYYVSGVGTLSRISAQVNVYLPAASQFRAKTETHENQHKTDFDNGYDGHDFVTVAEYFARIQNFTDSTQAGLVAQISAEAQAYFQDEANEIESVRGCLEVRAYQQSEPVSPQYRYHNCGQYTCP